MGNLTERQNAQAEGDGSTNIFKLPDENIAAITTCTVNSVAQTESPDDSPAAGQYYLAIARTEPVISCRPMARNRCNP